MEAERLTKEAIEIQINGRFREAEQLLRRSLQIRESILGNNHLLVADSLTILANTLFSIHQYSVAELLFRRALSIAEEALGMNDIAVASILNNLANVLVRQNNFDGAETIYRRSISIYELHGKNRPDTARALNNLASLLFRKGDALQAEDLHRRALTIREMALGTDHIDVASSLNNLAVVLEKEGEFGQAEFLHRRALAIREKLLGPQHPDVAQSLNHLAFLNRQNGEIQTGLDLARKASQAGHPSRGVYLHVIFGATNAYEERVSESFLAVQQVESSEAGAALRSLAVRVSAGGGALAKLVRSEQDLAAELKRLENAILLEVSKSPAARDAVSEAAIASRTVEVSTRLKQARDLLAQKFPDYTELSRPSWITLKETQALLRSEEALIVLDIANKGEGDDYVWAVTAQEVQWQRLQTRNGEIAAAIGQLRLGLDLDDIARKPIRPIDAYHLYEKLLGPVYGVIKSKKHIVFVLNGAVSSLPPQILVNKPPEGDDIRSAAWLVRDHAITVLPTVSSLKLLRTQTISERPSKPFRGYGDPVFNREREGDARMAARSYSAFFRGRSANIDLLRKSLPRLPGTADELRSVAQSIGASGNDIVLRADATEAAVKKARLNDYDIVYFATHGLVAGDVQKVSDGDAEPALAFTLPEKVSDLDDGLLTASEVSQLKLNANWVVLSACNTAAGDKPGAAALSGLARAFFYAGARSLLVSHWVVDDLATAELMKRTFAYSSLNRRKPPANALQHAMLSVMDDPDHPEWADPVYWSPFILVGEPYHH